MRSSKKFLSAVIGTAVALALVTSPALAQNGQWNTGPTLVLQGTNLLLSGKATGLGNATGVNFIVTGTIHVSSRCYTRKGNTPQAANKQEAIDVNAAFSVPVRNGQTTLNNVFVASVASTLSCPGNQSVVIEDISYDLTISADGFPGLTFDF